MHTVTAVDFHAGTNLCHLRAPARSIPVCNPLRHAALSLSPPQLPSLHEKHIKLHPGLCLQSSACCPSVCGCQAAHQLLQTTRGCLPPVLFHPSISVHHFWHSRALCLWCGSVHFSAMSSRFTQVDLCYLCGWSQWLILSSGGCLAH